MRKRCLLAVAAHKLAILMRRLLGAGKPRALADLLEQLADTLTLLVRMVDCRKSTGC